MGYVSLEKPLGISVSSLEDSELPGIICKIKYKCAFLGQRVHSVQWLVEGSEILEEFMII